jgi:protein phosphatase
VIEILLARVREADAIPELVALVQEASRAVLELGRQREELAGLGATVVAAAIRRSALEYAWSGDSRLYLRRLEHLELLTPPHELSRKLVSEGVLRAGEEADCPLRGHLTSYVGLLGGRIDRGDRDLLAGDTLILVSDGVLERGEAVIEAASEAEDVARGARLLAADDGTGDNATGIVARIQAMDDSCSANS